MHGQPTSVWFVCVDPLAARDPEDYAVCEAVSPGADLRKCRAVTTSATPVKSKLMPINKPSTYSEVPSSPDTVRRPSTMPISTLAANVAELGEMIAIL
jgi:hypothetical protein